MPTPARSSEPGTGPPLPAAPAVLTGREREVLAHRAVGRSINEIAAALVVEPRTVRFHLRKLYTKLGVVGRSQVARQHALADHARVRGLMSGPLEDMLARQADALFRSTLRTLVTTIEQRSLPTFQHSHRVALTADILGTALRLPAHEVEKLHAAGLLHDIGKVGVPEAVLTKHGRLDDAEFALIQQHVIISRQILEQVAYPSGWEDLPLIVGQHHERLSGRGYPDALSGDSICLGARILAVADVYDALRISWPPRRAFEPEAARTFLRSAANRGDLDVAVVSAFETRQGEIERACAPSRVA
jgi:HD-GYP domain-containing protein (c-di-GMP phosphodiesterase class II)